MIDCTGTWFSRGGWVHDVLYESLGYRVCMFRVWVVGMGHRVAQLFGFMRVGSVE